MKKVVVTRHPALVEYLLHIGMIDSRAEVVTHASPDVVRGKHVVGILPLDLAALTASITTVPLDLPVDLRGVELTLEQVKAHAGTPKTYVVKEVA